MNSIDDVMLDLYMRSIIKREEEIEKMLGLRVGKLRVLFDRAHDEFLNTAEKELKCSMADYLKKILTSDIKEKLYSKNAFFVLEAPNVIRNAVEEVRHKAIIDLKKCQSICEMQCYQMLTIEISPLELEAQYTIDKMTVDIAIPEKKIVIEVDGEQYHKNQNRTKDCYRDVRLREYGWIVLRYPCTVIFRSFKDDPSYFLNDVLLEYNKKRQFK